MKTILNISRLHQQELQSVIKMLPDDPMNQYIITGYKIINPDDTPTGDPPGMITPRDVTVAQYETEVATYQERHQMDIDSSGIQIIETYTRENIPTQDIIDNLKILDAHTVPQDASEYDLIVIGIGDAGVNIFKKIQIIDPLTQEVTSEYSQLQALSDARDAGVPIIFTHDCMEVNSFCEPFPEDYEELMGNFGILSYDYNYGESGDIVEDIECTNVSHPIMSAYFDLPETLDVQTTHHGGLVLKAETDIVYINSGKEPTDANYYLATYEVAGKGKVVFCIMGHCFGNMNQFFRPSLDECKILVNSIVWALQ